MVTKVKLLTQSLKLEQMKNEEHSVGTESENELQPIAPTSRQTIANTHVMCSQSGVSPETALTYEQVLREGINIVTEGMYGSSNFTPKKIEFSEIVTGDVITMEVLLNSKVVYSDSYRSDNIDQNKEQIRKRFLNKIISKWVDSISNNGQPIPAMRSSSGDRKMFL